MDLRHTVDRIQNLVSAETGRRLGSSAEQALSQLLGNAGTANPQRKDDFVARELTILFADLRGFMAISNRYPPETVLQVLNRCLVTMIDVVFAHEGTIDKFMGDSIMAHFSESSSGKEPAQRAVLCALGLQLAMDALNVEHQRSGLPELFLGIGINTGSVLVGTLGSELYQTHTVIGEEVNIAARIEALSLRGQVLLSETTYQRCSALAKTGEPFSVHVKGKAEPIIVRELLEIPSLNRAVPRRDIRKSPRVNVAIGFSYQVVHADVTVPQVHKGVIRVLGYHGLLAETKEPLHLSEEMKIRVDLPLVNHRASDIYGRVKKCSRAEQGFHCGIEFTAITSKTRSSIELLVQLLMQVMESE
ncbi:MAG TPA: adenylate/guanylate cyclase domain-containing protein [Burkholderiales bacterium]|nr:adenylate/guanylate cyclase domain-containing protein [Burkholderiales bacterium]